MINQEELLTAIGDGLATTCARLEDAEPTSRIIVLLSDGESNTGIIEPRVAAQVARKLGIKVYTIGVGSTGRAPIRRKDVFGRDVIGKIQVTLDEDLLKEIAQTTGGRYFNVRNPRGLDRALDDINELEKTRIDRDVYNQYNELFPYFLWPALALLLVGSGLNMLLLKRIM